MLGNSEQRDKELTDVFHGDGTVRNQRLRDQDTIDKNKWLNELIRFKLKDSDGNTRPGCEWRIQRRKAVIGTLQDLVNRCPLKCDVDYVYDSRGTVYWMEDMLMQGQPDPEFYTIVPVTRRMPDDISGDPHYDGQIVFLITRIPIHSKDDKTEVDARTLKEWLLTALIEVDPYSKPFYGNIKRIAEEIKVIDKKIKGIPKIKFNREDGSPMNQEEADQERELLYDEIGKERLKAQTRLKRQELALDGHKLWRRNMGIDLQKGMEDKNTDTAAWYVRFYGTSDAGEMENLLLKKDDWGGLKLACGSATENLAPWAGRGQLPDGSKPFLPDYTKLQVNISGARLMRVPHGVGTFKVLDRKSSESSGDQFHFYYGDWHDGERSGTGIEVNESGIYSGRFYLGYRQGQGRLDLANGTTIVGQFDYPHQISPRDYGVFRNPYLSGDMHGDVEILFGDGGFYRGQAYDGKITGKGEYQSGFGAMKSGWFVDGVLHGTDIYEKNLAQEEFVGTFVEGEVHGKACYLNDYGDTYEGYFERAMKHGRGIDYYAKKKGSYRGYYINGTRTGKGELDFGRRRIIRTKKEPKKNEEKTSSGRGIDGENENPDVDEHVKKDAANDTAASQVFVNRFQGYMLSNSIASGGTLQDTIEQIPKVIARRDKRATYGINSLMNKLSERAKTIKRKIEKYTDMEHSIKKEMETKKTRIFKQQKHYTKSALYTDEQLEGGLDKRLLLARSKVRETRLEKMDVEGLKSKNALVPRLKIVDYKAEKYMSKTFQKIEIEREIGETKKVRTLMARLAVSDIEEIQERSRFLKYDKMWERAEEAFLQKKREQD
jgi:hypothetical protein